MDRIDDSPRPAMHWRSLAPSAKVECGLCPRHCRPSPGQSGFCQVRGNRGGEMMTFNYGRSVQVAQESIETEAVFHWGPGSRILSLGNIGCMMNCTYCHNWQTSQVKYLDPTSVHQYTPEQVVDIALEHDIKILSWTYNDPVVWHEFVLDTARLAARQGIANLYKSAFYIEEKPAAELIEVMDIFSISLKSMSPDLYRKVTKGTLEPVLARIEQVHRSGRHLEISQLLVTDLNDAEGEIRKTARWVRDHIGPETPMHFVRFHPAYQYTHTGRTPVKRLLRAREIAREEGMRHIYLGNLYRDGVADTRCSYCKETLVRRFGLSVDIIGLSETGRCQACGTASPITQPFFDRDHTARDLIVPPEVTESTYHWNEEVNALHVVLESPGDERVQLFVHTLPGSQPRVVSLGRGLNRAMIARSFATEAGVRIRWSSRHRIRLLPVLDRAHFPVRDETVDVSAPRRRARA